MTFRSLLISLAAAAGLLGPAAAQDTATPPPANPPAAEAPARPQTEAPAQPQTEAPAKPTELDQAFPIAESEQPREVLKGKFDDWEVRCAATDETKCFLYQLAKDSEGRPVAELTMIRLPDGGQASAGATIVTGLGVVLTKGLTLTIDTGQPLGYPFLYCAPS
ncbi:MAG TPA: invasion associated locus B family protein, partial [Paracoccaceae bacterium]|nr:invasion associated locus B family protein [Paracoccaceae bacterium]